MAGQDITLWVDQLTVKVEDTLGQGAGAGGGGTGRATTCTFDTRLGPATTAYGAGQSLPTSPPKPVLVRNGEVVITDASGVIIFGGYATKLTDTTNTTTVATTVQCIDYSTSLDRILINKAYSTKTDIEMLTDIFTTYVPSLDISAITSKAPTYTFPTKLFRNVSVEKSINQIADTTGYLIWVDFNRKVHYDSPSITQTAPFSLSSSPDKIVSFPFRTEEYLIDDNSAINRITFFGGRKPTPDFTQDMSPLANGNNKVFGLLYYPRKAIDGNYHVTVNGVEKTIGYETGTGTENTLISAGGTAQVLINPEAKTITFDTAPTAGQTVLARYRYEYPLITITTDENSHRFFGTYLDGVVSDDTIFDTTTAVQRSRVVLLQKSYGLTSFKVICYKAGLQAGQLLRVYDSVRQIHGTFLIQQVTTSPYGGGNFYYEVSLGAWNWNLVDIVLKLAKNAEPTDQNQVESETIVYSFLNTDTMNVTDEIAYSLPDEGGYFARSTAVHDGHDAYPGFASITS